LLWITSSRDHINLFMEVTLYSLRFFLVVAG
jgi:hypothetical protein